MQVEIQNKNLRKVKLLGVRNQNSVKLQKDVRGEIKVSVR